MKELAAARVGYGYRRLHILLQNAQDAARNHNLTAFSAKPLNPAVLKIQPHLLRFEERLRSIVKPLELVSRCVPLRLTNGRVFSENFP